jgi:hypothetical protein
VAHTVLNTAGGGSASPAGGAAFATTRTLRDCRAVRNAAAPLSATGARATLESAAARVEAPGERVAGGGGVRHHPQTSARVGRDDGRRGLGERAREGGRASRGGAAEGGAHARGVRRGGDSDGGEGGHGAG